MSQQALPLIKNLVIPAEVRNPLDKLHRVRRQPGYYAGQEVTYTSGISALRTATIVEVDGQLAELSDGEFRALNALTFAQPDEEWKAIEGFEGRYLLSNYGKVVSTQFHRQNRERVLQTARNKTTGYTSVRLSMGRVREDVGVARLVATHFLPAPSAEAKMVVNLDRNPDNFYYRNLGWVGEESTTGLTVRQAPSGEAHHSSRLSDAQVTEMRQAYAQGGVTHQQLAERYGVSRAAVTLRLGSKTYRAKESTCSQA